MKRTLALFLAVAMCFSLAAPPVSAAQEDGSAGSSSYVDESASAASSGKADASSAQEPEHSDASASSSASASASSSAASSASAEEEPEQRPEADRSAEAQAPEDSSEQTEQPSVPAEEDEEPEWPADDEPEDVRTIRKSLKTVDGVRYTFTLTCGEDAGIPDNAKLSIVELNQALTEEELEKKENKKRPFDTERFVSEKALEQDSFDLRQGLKVRKKDYVLFTKFLDLSLTADGRKVQPKAPVTVTLETDAVEEGASGALEAAFYDKTATKKWRKEREKLVREQKEQLRTGELKEEDAKRFPERVFTPVEISNETEQDKGVKLSFELEEFDRLGVTGVVKRVKSWKVKGERVCVYGPRSLKARVTRESLKTPRAGLEKLRAFSVEPDEKTPLKYDVTFWVGGTPERYEQTDGQLTAMDADGDPEAGVVACELKRSGKAGHTLIGTAGTDAPVAIKPGKRVGLLWDTGLREQSVEADKVSVEGMLPKNAQLTANDMLWRYSRPGEVVADVSGDAETLAAYDITISGRRGEFQPDERTSVSVSIRDEAISSKKQLELWHLKDDGSVDIIRDFTVKGDTLSFDAGGFSVYMVVQVTREQTLSASDGNQYKVTVTYDTDSGIPEDAQLQVSELTTGKRYNRYVKKAAKALKKERSQLSCAHAFDIALVNPETGAHYQPTKPLTVSVELLDGGVEQGDRMSVVHFGAQTEVLSSRVVGDSVEFETDGFSLFIVAREALLKTFVFYSQDDDGNYYPCSEQVLTDGETLVKPADPTTGGAVFDHWSSKAKPEDETVPDSVFSAITIDPSQIEGDTDEAKQRWLDANPTKFYAVFLGGKVAVTFYNQSGQVYRRDLVNEGGTLPHIYNYTEDVVQNKDGIWLSFAGWVDNPQGTGPLVNGSTTFREDTSLYPKLTEGHYLHFNSNLDGASTIQSLIVPVGSYSSASGAAADVLSLLTADHIPTADGYTFTGWYISPIADHDFDADQSTKTVPVFYPSGGGLAVNESEYVKLLNPSFNLPNSPTLYAHWVKAPESDPGAPTPEPTTAPYAIQIWAQSAEDETHYDFVTSVSATGNIGVDASTTVNGTDYAQYGPTLGTVFQANGRVVRNSDTVQADGSTVVNIYYDRSSGTVTVRFMRRDGYEEEPGTSGTQYGLVDGDYVELTYADPASTLSKDDPWAPDVYSYSHEVYEAVTGTPSGTVFYVQPDGTYAATATGLGTYTKTTEVRRYTGQRYQKNADGTFSETEDDGSSFYGRDDNSNYVPLTASHWTYDDNGTAKNYTGTRYVAKTTPDWYEWKTLTGRCGQTFAQQDPDWSETLNFDWYAGIDAGTKEVTGDPVQGLDRFVSDKTYYGTKLPAAAKTVTFCKQKADDLSGYEQASRFTVTGGTFAIDKDKYSGFEAAKYKADDGDWTDYDASAGAVSFTSKLEVRYNRKKHSLTFSKHDNGSSSAVAAQTDVPYGAKLSSAVAKLPKAERDGYHFDGWYRDPALHRRVTAAEYAAFTMPDQDVTFYAKWTAVKHLVRLVPNGGELPETQSPLLYVTYGNKISLPKSITREYVNVGEGKGEYNYDDFYGRYELAGQKTADTCYSSRASAYQFKGWYLATPVSGSERQIIEYSAGKYAYAYGDYERKDGGSYTYNAEDDSYEFVGEGKGDYAFVYAEPEKAGSDYVTSDAAFNSKTESVKNSIILVAKWKMEGTFRVKYDVKDPNYPNLDYTDVTAPVDETEYVDGGSARVLPAVTAPDGYTLDYWSAKNDPNQYRSNDLVTVGSNNAELGSDGLMWVTLTAHYRPYDTTERDIAEFKFMTPKSPNTYVSGTADYGKYDLYDKQKISKGETLTLPATPNAPGEGYVFRGWFYDKKGNYPFRDFSPTNPTCTILYALFEKSVSVDFYLTEAVGNQYTATTKVLATRTYPVDGYLDTLGVDHPLDADHYVDKWIAGESNWNTYKTNPDAVEPKYIFGYKSTSATKLSELGDNRKLYAVLKERKYVLFDTQGGSYVVNQELPETGIPERPTDPTKNGFLFAGWYTGPETDANAVEYTFERDFRTVINDYNTGNTGTLYAHWDANTNAKGTLHVIFWAQTADRPEDAAAAAADKEHYQMLYSVDLDNCVPYGKHEREGAYLKSQLSDFLDSSGNYDLIKTVRKGLNENQGAAEAFVTDALGYKGNNADVIQNYNPEEYIDDLNRYYEFNSTKSDASVVVDGSDNTVLNIRFDLKTFRMEFEPKFDSNNWCEIHYGGKIYGKNPTQRYGFDIWLNRSIPEKLWPGIWNAGETVPGDDTAYFEWNHIGNYFHSWQITQYQLTGTSVKQEYKKANYRAPMNLSDKLLIDTAIDKGNGTVLFKPDKNTGANKFTKIGVVHFLLRNGKTDTFTERRDLRTEVRVPDYATNSGAYPHFTQSKCLMHKKPQDHYHSKVGDNGNPWDKYGYNEMQPAGIPGYTVIDNETGHEGDLEEKGGTQATGEVADLQNLSNDNLNMLFLYNLIKDRIGRPQIILNTATDYSYQNYFQNHLDGNSNGADGQFDTRQLESNSNVYNLYFYYKPLSYELTLCTDSSTQVGTPQDVFCGENLRSYLTTPTPPAAYRVGYRFAGWATSPFQSSASAAIDTNTFTMPAYNLTLYAVWEPVTCKVTTQGVNEKGFTTDTDLSATYLGSYGQRLRELNIPNPQKNDSLFQHWTATDNPVTGMHTLITDLTIRPEWRSLETHQIFYHDKRASDTDLTPTGSVPTDTNLYIEGAKAVIRDGKGLTATRTDINGASYNAAFTCWEDAKGNRYYPNDSYTMTSADLDLYAVYSAYRETKLTYHNGGGTFIKSDGTSYPGPLTDGNIVVNFRDWLRQDFTTRTDMIPNEQFIIARDQNGIDFTVALNGGSGSMVLAGWSSEKDGPVVACSGDKGYLNALAANTDLWPVWGICKVVDRDKKEHVFKKIQDAVSFIENNGEVTGRPKGNITNKTGKVEMLIDYEMSSSTETQVTIPSGAHVTLSTAGQWNTAPKGEVLFYNGTGKNTDGRGTITRGSNNKTNSLFKVVSGGSFTTEKIIFDGGAKFNEATHEYTSGEVNVHGGIVNVDSGTLTIGQGTTMRKSAVKSDSKKGGAVYVSQTGTLNITGNSSNGVVFTECQAFGGGAIFTGEDKDKDNPYTGTVSIGYCRFTYCYAKGNKDEGGISAGGAVRCTANTFTLDHCEYEDCTTVRQGGAVYHRGNTSFSATDCIFTSCKAGVSTTQAAGGGAETQAPSVTMERCTFTDCTSTRNAGAVNFYRNGSITATVQYCTFTNCTTKKNSTNDTKDGDGFGGALRSYGTGTMTIINSTFSGCEASWGGAVACFGSVKIEGATTITNCTAKKGGGIYLLNNNTLTLDANAEDESGNSVYMLKDCHADLGGGIYQAQGTCNFNSGTIYQCYATTNGGGVYLGNNSNNQFFLNGGTITECYAVTSGGGIYLGGGKTFEMTDGLVSGCCAPSGGGIYIGAKLTNPVEISKNGDAITGCEARKVEIRNNVATATDVPKSGNQGGGIYQAGGTLNITQPNAAIHSCEAWEGGGIYLGGGKDTSLTLSGKIGEANKANKANTGGGIYQSGGTMTIYSGASVTGNEATDNGGGIYLAQPQNTTSQLFLYGAIGGTTDGTGNTATNGGGIYQNGGTLEMKSGAQVTGNHADTGNGGGIYLGSGTFTFSGGSIGGTTDGSGNTATNGGGIYQGGGTLTIGTLGADNNNGGKVQDNVATTTSLSSDDGCGGGIYLGGGTFTLNSGYIGVQNDDDEPENGKTGGNRARKGGGLYVGNGASSTNPTTASIAGGVIGGNHATEPAGGGGIAIGGEFVHLNFSGNIQVWGNTMKPTDEKPHQKRCDVCLSEDSNDVIWTTDAGLDEDSHIGVYVPSTPSKKDSSKLLHEDLHGMADMRFGTYKQSGNGVKNLSRFINNRSGSAYDGYEYYYGVSHPGDNGIYWASYICEITDAKGNLLFTNKKATAPALYQYLGKYGAFEALANHTRFYTKKKQQYNGTDYYVRMLVYDYELQWPEAVEVPNNGKIWLVMAAPGDTNLPPDLVNQYHEARNGCTTIHRGAAPKSLFSTADGSNFTIECTILDGRKKNTDTGEWTDEWTVDETGGLITSRGNLTLGGNTVLQHGKVTANKSGGAIRFYGSGTFALNNQIESNKQLPPTTYQNVPTSGDYAQIKDCTAKHGAALSVGKGEVFFNANCGRISNCTWKDSNDYHSGNSPIYVNGGTLNLDGTIINQPATAASTGTQPEESSCVFSGCASKNGGLAFVTGSGTLNLNADVSGFRSDSTKASNGGVLYVTGGTANLNGTVTNCTAASNGGAAYVNGGTLNLNGTIQNCEAPNGGGVCAKGGTVNLEQSGSKITNCTASNNGGAIFAGAESNNIAAVNMRAGELSGNTANGYGGGAIRVESGASVTIRGGTFTGNTASSTKETYGGAINIKKGTVTIYDGTFSGNSSTTSNSNYSWGGAIHVAGTPSNEEGTLIIHGGTFCDNYAGAANSGKYAYGGAISMRGENASVTIDGGTFSGNRAINTSTNKYACGGAIAVMESAALTLSGGTISGNYVKNSRDSAYAKGPGIYLGYKKIDKLSSNDPADIVPGILKLSGSPSFGGTGIYREGTGENQKEYLLALGSTTVTKTVDDGNGGTTQKTYTLYRRYYKNEVTSGTSTKTETVYPDNDGNTYYMWDEGKLYTVNSEANNPAAVDTNVIPDIGNFLTETLSGKKNGGKDYFQTRQDIFIDGFQGVNATSLVVTGRLTQSNGNATTAMDKGSIWVGAAESPHYLQNMQFASFGGDAVNKDESGKDVLTDACKAYAEETMMAFRNACDDGKTANTTGDFLYGEAGDGVYINWTGVKGSARVILKKVGSAYEPLEGAKFELYRGDAQIEWPGTSPTNLATSTDIGVLWIGDLPYGEYYLKETTAPTGYSGNANRWFCLIVDKTGVWMSEKGYTGTDAAKTDAEAVKAAGLPTT